MNNTYKLPDAYAKRPDSNNYKLLELGAVLSDKFATDLQDIFESRNFKNATGKTLDRYGEMIGQPRNGATDKQYRMKIISRMGRLASDGSCDATIKLIAEIVGQEPESIYIIEENMSVKVIGLSSNALQSSGYKSNDVTALIKDVLPIGIGLEPPQYAGTLLVMGDYIRVYAEDGTYDITSVDANGNYQYPPIYGTFHPSNMAQLPTLQAAYNLGQWYYQKSHDGIIPDGCLDVGLAGEANYPEDGIIYDADGTWLGVIFVGAENYNDEWLVNHTYKGGTLGITSGDDE